MTWVTPIDGCVGRALAGNSDAWADLFRRHARRVVVALLARGLSLAEAHDASQDAWARLIECSREGSLERLELPGLVIRQALFFAEKRRSTDERRQHLSLGLGRLNLDPGPESQVASRAALSLARRALEAESHLNRQVFFLAYQDELPHEEIAARVGRSTQRVRQILYEVRVRLRAVFGDRP